MSNTRRPAAERKHTRKTEESRTDALEQGLVVTIDGATHTVRLGDVTSSLVRELRREAGLSMRQLMDEITTDPDVDVIATFVWLARRMDGEENLALDDVVYDYTHLLGDDFNVEAPGKREVDGDPEA